MFNRLETERRLSRLERAVRRLCCRPCTTDLGTLDWFSQMSENSTLLVNLNGVQVIDGADGFFSVEGHAYFGSGTFNLHGGDIITFVTGGTITITDPTFNIIFQQTVDPGFQYTVECGLDYNDFTFNN